MTKKLTTIIAMLFVISGCAATGNQPNANKGALWGTGIGAAVGAGLGQAIGKNTESTMIGAGVGAALGAGAGYAWGGYLDKQESALRKEFDKQDAVQIKRDEEQLSLTFKADMLFGVGQSTINPGAMHDIQRVATVLNQYPQSIIVVRGHTDSTGSEQNNQTLSEKRAEAIKNLLVAEQVNPERILTIGYGEMEPIASNDTEAGRQANRRVEISIANPETAKS